MREPLRYLKRRALVAGLFNDRPDQAGRIVIARSQDGTGAIPQDFGTLTKATWAEVAETLRPQQGDSGVLTEDSYWMRLVLGQTASKTSPDAALNLFAGDPGRNIFEQLRTHLAAVTQHMAKFHEYLRNFVAALVVKGKFTKGDPLPGALPRWVMQLALEGRLCAGESKEPLPAGITAEMDHELRAWAKGSEALVDLSARLTALRELFLNETLMQLISLYPYKRVLQEARQWLDAAETGAHGKQVEHLPKRESEPFTASELWLASAWAFHREPQGDELDEVGVAIRKMIRAWEAHEPRSVILPTDKEYDAADSSGLASEATLRAQLRNTGRGLLCPVWLKRSVSSIGADVEEAAIQALISAYTRLLGGTESLDDLARDERILQVLGHERLQVEIEFARQFRAAYAGAELIRAEVAGSNIESWVRARLSAAFGRPRVSITAVAEDFERQIFDLWLFTQPNAGNQAEAWAAEGSTKVGEYASLSNRRFASDQEMQAALLGFARAALGSVEQVTHLTTSPAYISQSREVKLLAMSLAHGLAELPSEEHLALRVASLVVLNPAITRDDSSTATALKGVGLNEVLVKGLLPAAKAVLEREGLLRAGQQGDAALPPIGLDFVALTPAPAGQAAVGDLPPWSALPAPGEYALIPSSARLPLSSPQEHAREMETFSRYAERRFLAIMAQIHLGLQETKDQHRQLTGQRKLQSALFRNLFLVLRPSLPGPAMQTHWLNLKLVADLLECENVEDFLGRHALTEYHPELSKRGFRVIYEQKRETERRPVETLPRVVGNCIGLKSLLESMSGDADLIIFNGTAADFDRELENRASSLAAALTLTGGAGQVPQGFFAPGVVYFSPLADGVSDYWSSREPHLCDKTDALALPPAVTDAGASSGLRSGWPDDRSPTVPTGGKNPFSSAPLHYTGPGVHARGPLDSSGRVDHFSVVVPSGYLATAAFLGATRVSGAGNRTLSNRERLVANYLPPQTWMFNLTAVASGGVTIWETTRQLLKIASGQPSLALTFNLYLCLLDSLIQHWQSPLGQELSQAIYGDPAKPLRNLGSFRLPPEQIPAVYRALWEYVRSGRDTWHEGSQFLLAWDEWENFSLGDLPAELPADFPTAFVAKEPYRLSANLRWLNRILQRY